MELTDLSETELEVWHAFTSGTRVDVRKRKDVVVRSSVVRFLLLGGVERRPGCLPALRLDGAHLTGQLEVAYADIAVPISFHECHFDERMDLYGAHFRQLSFRGCAIPGGFTASNAVIEVNLRLTGVTSRGEINLVGTEIGGALILDGADLAAPTVALNATRLRVGHDILAHENFSCHGEIRMNDAEIGGSLRWQGAQLHNPGAAALFAPDLRVGAIAELCDGFSANGDVVLVHARIASKLCFDGAQLAGTGDYALNCSHLTAGELVLLPTEPPAGAVDLSQARVGLLRDAPRSWPTSLRLEGLTYEALSDTSSVADRRRWLRLDPRGYRPQAYGQLAKTYRSTGRDDDARLVMLAGERHRRESLPWPGKIWGWLQDVTVGYGYRPMRASIWLAALVLFGSTVFSWHPPVAAEPSKAPPFLAPIYTLDLLIPIVDLGQRSAFYPRGAYAWLAYMLTVLGLLFATTIAAAAARRLKRE